MDFNYQRCPRSGVVVDGNHVGDILYTTTISVYHRTKPNTPIAVVVRCAKCSYIDRIYLIPGAKEGDTRHPSEAQRLGIELSMVKDCYKQMPLDAYTLAELKAGKVRGAKVNMPDIEYDPNQFTEPKAPIVETEIF